MTEPEPSPEAQEPASKADVAAMRDSVESMRAQNSAEHGAQDAKLEHIAAMMGWLKAKWQTFMRPTDGK
jgi:hypothetical protein